MSSAQVTKWRPTQRQPCCRPLAWPSLSVPPTRSCACVLEKAAGMYELKMQVHSSLPKPSEAGA